MNIWALREEINSLGCTVRRIGYERLPKKEGASQLVAELDLEGRGIAVAISVCSDDTIEEAFGCLLAACRHAIHRRMKERAQLDGGCL